jgi:hypothetical protein
MVGICFANEKNHNKNLLVEHKAGLNNSYGGVNESIEPLNLIKSIADAAASIAPKHDGNVVSHHLCFLVRVCAQRIYNAVPFSKKYMFISII